MTDVDQFRVDAMVHRKDIQDEEKKADQIIEHCDALHAMSSSAMAIVAAVRWKRKVAKAQ